MAVDHETTTPTGRKRQFPQAGAEPASTPASNKRLKLDDASPASPSAPRALNAIASAISGVFGYGRQAQKPSDGGTDAAPDAQPRDTSGLAPPVASPSHGPAGPPARPAIKLAALRGTKWDKGDIAGPGLARKSATPAAKSSPASSRARGRAQSGGPASSSMRRPRHDSPGSPDELADAVADSPTKSRSTHPPSRQAATPKGILTPSKKRGPPPKSVTFNRGLEGEVLFQDLPKTPRGNKSRASTRKKTNADDDDDDDDEIRCAICSKPDSEAPNEIILCDNCDFAAHQVCYQVSEIPEGDWLCKSCAQEDVLQTPSGPVDAAGDKAAAVAEKADIANLERHLRSFQRVLLDRCCGRRRIRMFGQEEAYDKARQLVEQTVVAGEGNSMLLIGPRGCGKTTVRRRQGRDGQTGADEARQMVENIIQDLAREHRHLFHVVRLSGFIHTDDKVALKEIWRQLGKEMEVEDDLVNRVSSAPARGRPSLTWGVGGWGA